MAIKDVRERGAGVDPAADTAIINAAIREAVAENGGTVYFPAGVYHVRQPLVVNGHGVRLRGDPSGSVLVVEGSFDTIAIGNPSGAEQGDNGVENLFLDEQAKTAGKSIFAHHVARLQIGGVLVSVPFDGIHVHNFNTVRIERTRIFRPRGTYCCLLTGGGPSDGGRSDVVSFYDTVFEGNSRPGDPPDARDRHGLIVDGFVSTVSAHKIYFIAVEGAALWIRNTLPAAHDPEFATIYGLEAEFMRYEGVRIERGQRFYFTDALLHGSLRRENVAILGPANSVSFNGGVSSGARLAGFRIFGRQVSVQGMDVLANSQIGAGTWAGIVLEGSSRSVSISGNKCGDPGNRTQSHGIQINSGADQFAVTGNVLFDNLNPGVLNPTTPDPGRVVANNASRRI